MKQIILSLEAQNTLFSHLLNATLCYLLLYILRLNTEKSTSHGALSSTEFLGGFKNACNLVFCHHCFFFLIDILLFAYCQEPASMSISSQFSRFECLLPFDGLFTTSKFHVYFLLNHCKEIIDI